MKLESEDELLGLVDELRSFESKFGLSNRFNLFEAVNMVRQEIRHSRFLAFLLDPSESHDSATNFSARYLSQRRKVISHLPSLALL